MHILAVNCGSSSIKVRVFDADRDFRLLVKGVAERIGRESASLALVTENHRELRKTLPLPDHRVALRALHQTLVEGDADFVETVRPIGGAGHRIVHGGERFRAPVLITAEVIAGIAEAARFAPLHCRPNLIGIEVAQELLPDIPHVAVFDTAAHQSLPPRAFLYGLPAELYAKYKVRRYGFHGINHSYVAHVAAQMVGQPLADLKVITCHLGNGCSITAFAQGQSVDTSMGLTPLEGLLMGTRCGDLDPAIVLYLMERERVVANLAYLGAHVDRGKNERNAPVFSSEASRITLLTIGADEERVIAQQTYELLTQSEEPSVGKMALGSSET